MELINKYPVKIFAKEYQGKTFYKVGLSKKDRNGTYINGYMDCYFKQGVSVPDKTSIYLKKAYLMFYLDKNNKTVPYIQISEFDTEEKAAEKAKDPFEAFGDKLDSPLGDEQLPF